MQKRLTEIQIQDIIKQYKDGVPPKEIAKRYNIYNNSVTRIIRKNGIERNQLIKISEEETKYIIEQYSAGVSSEVIALKLNRDGGTICRVLKRNGIKIRPATQNKRQYQIREDFFETIDNEEKAYFLGLLYADGNLSKRGHCIKLTLKDRDILEVWSKIIYGFVKISQEERIDEDGIIRIYHSVHIYSQRMHQDLCKLDCTPKKTFSITFPKWIREHPLCNHFVRGYFDGDGCISINGENRGIIDITSNIEFIKDCVVVINDLLNIPCYFGINKKKPRSACLQISKQEDVNIFLNYIYKNSSIFLPRKKDKTEKFYKIFNNFEEKNEIKNYGTFFIPKYQNIELKSANLAKMSAEEKDEVAKFIFDFYRSNGFPYTELTDDELIKEFSILKKLDVSKIETNHKLSIANYIGTSIFKHFSPHFYEMKSGYSSKFSMLEAFNDDLLLLKTIKNRIDGNYTIHGNMIKQGLRNSRVAFIGSIFNTTVAKFLYQTYTKENDIIYDYSMGFGQRLLGALSLPYKIKYIGVDPLARSVDSNNKIFNYFNKNVPMLNKEVELLQCGSEEYDNDLYRGKIKFAFSSPPYFDLEFYEDNKKQAYYGGYNKFINEWWRKTVENIKNLLSNDGIFAININEQVNKFNIAEDMCNMIKSYGFKEFDRYDLILSKNTNFNNKNNNNSKKLEPIFLFSKGEIK